MPQIGQQHTGAPDSAARARLRHAVPAVLAAVLLALAVSGPARSTPGTGHVALSSLESGIVVELNRIRANHGLTPLRLSIGLTEAAEQHSHEMGLDGYFAHSSFDGAPYWRRISSWYGWSGYRTWSVGENLLWSSPNVAPALALDLWMHSSEHRANILSATWREVGIAAVHVDAAGGPFDGRAVTLITTDFGVRR